MRKMEFTPEEWRVYYDLRDNDGRYHKICDVQDVTIANIPINLCDPPEWARNNTTVMAAARELLEALQDATSRLEEWIGSDCECDNTHKQNNTVCCLCEYRQAIAKATEGGE